MKHWLDGPRLYEWTQTAVTSPDCWRRFTDIYLKPIPGGRLLDLGCGTGILLDSLPTLEYWGLDADMRFIRYAQKKGRAGARFICADLNKRPWPVQGSFDRVTATGVLHHLPDREAADMLKNVRSLLKPHGKFVTFDGCFEKAQSPLARWLLSHDRGKYVRQREAYEALARSVFPRVEAHLERRFLRLPYSHLVMEMGLN